MHGALAPCLTIIAATFSLSPRPKTQAYRISGSAKLFPQHYQMPFLMWNEHLQEVIDELVTTIKEMDPSKQARVLTLVKKKLASA